MSWDSPEYANPYPVGSVVKVKSYCFNNKAGGTEMVNESALCKITKAWWDYECGWRYHAKKAFGGPEKIFVSQFDVVGKSTLLKKA